MFPKIHALIDGKLPCGVRVTTHSATVPPHRAKFVTCKRCLASLRKKP